MNYKIKIVLSWLIGYSIWIPSICISIAGVWGVQSIVIFSIFSLLVFLLTSSKSKYSSIYSRYTKGVVWFSFLFLTIFISTLFGVLAFSRGSLSALSEVTLLIVAFAVYIACIYSIETKQALLSGFYASAVISSMIACMQFIGLNQGVRFFAWELYNPSFSLFAADSALLHQRAYAFTPEPSILSGLLLSAIAMQVVRVRSSTGHREWMVLILFLMAIISTASQGLVFLPLSIFSGVWVTRKVVKNRQSSRVTLFYGWLLFLMPIIGLLTIESLQRNFLNRFLEVFSGSSEGSSFGSRSESILASYRMFLDYPLLGAGPGSTTEVILNYVTNDVDIGAASAFVRYVAEFGVAYLFVWIVLSIQLFRVALKIRRQELFLDAQLIVISMWFMIAACSFIGYRTLYQNIAWIGVVIALGKIKLRKKISRYN